MVFLPFIFFIGLVFSAFLQAEEPRIDWQKGGLRVSGNRIEFVNKDEILRIGNLGLLTGPSVSAVVEQTIQGARLERWEQSSLSRVIAEDAEQSLSMHSFRPTSPAESNMVLYMPASSDPFGRRSRSANGGDDETVAVLTSNEKKTYQVRRLPMMRLPELSDGDLIPNLLAALWKTQDADYLVLWPNKAALLYPPGPQFLGDFVNKDMRGPAFIPLRYAESSGSVKEAFILGEGGWLGGPKAYTNADQWHCNAIGFAKNWFSDQAIFGYDEVAGIVVAWYPAYKKGLDNRSPLSTFADLGIAPTGPILDVILDATYVPLPHPFHHKRPFDEVGHLKELEDGRVVILPNHLDGGRFFEPVPLTTRHYVSKDGPISGPLEAKNRKRALFAGSARELRSLVDLQAGSDLPELSEASGFLRRRIDQWNSQNIEGAANRFTMAFLTVPNAVLNLNPDLGYRFAKRVSSLYLEMSPGAEEETSALFYFKFPFRSEPGTLRPLADFVANLLVKDKLSIPEDSPASDRTVRFTLVLDLSHFGSVRNLPTLEEMKSIFKVVQEQGPASEMQRLEVQFFALLPSEGVGQYGEVLNKYMLNSPSGESEVFGAEAWLESSLQNTWIAQLITGSTRSSFNPENLSPLITAIGQELGGEWFKFMRLEEFASRLRSAIKQLGLKLNHITPSHFARIAKTFRQMTGVRPSEPMPADVRGAIRQLPLMLNAASPTHVEGAMLQRDDQLTFLSRKLSTFAGYSVNNSDHSPVVTLIGPPGSGKTLLAKGLRQAIPRSVMEIINASEFPAPGPGVFRWEKNKSSETDSDPNQDPLIQKIQEAIDELRNSPEPLKFLFLDEVSAALRLTLDLMSSVDVGDKKNSRIFNFDGIVVIMCLNIDHDSSQAQQLEVMQVGSYEYQQTAGVVLLNFLQKHIGKEGGNERVAEAFVSRVKPGIIYFNKRKPDISEARAQIREELSVFEDRHGFQIILQESAFEFMRKRLGGSNDGFREGVRYIHGAVEGAIADWLDKHGKRTLKGQIFVLEAPLDPLGLNYRIENLLDLDHGLEFLMEDAYRLYVNSIKKALHGWIGHLKLTVESFSGSKTKKAEYYETIAKYEAFLAAFCAAASEPLFGSRKVGGEIYLGRAIRKWEEVSSFFLVPPEGDAEEIFKKVWNENVRENLSRFHHLKNPVFGSVIDSEHRFRVAKPDGENKEDESERKANEERALHKQALDVATLLMESINAVSLRHPQADPINRKWEESNKAAGLSPILSPSLSTAQMEKYPILKLFHARHSDAGGQAEMRKEELSLMREQFEKWRQTVKKMGEIPAEEQRHAGLLKFTREYLEAIERFSAKFPAADMEILKGFLDKLPVSDEGGANQAESFIKLWEQRTNESQDAAYRGALQYEGVPAMISAGFAFDEQIRRILAGVMEENSEDRRKWKRMAAYLAGGGPNDLLNGDEAGSRDCEALLLAHIRESKVVVDDILDAAALRARAAKH